MNGIDRFACIHIVRVIKVKNKEGSRESAFCEA